MRISDWSSDVCSSDLELASLPPGDLAQVRFSRDESRLALMLSSDTSPRDVYTVDLAAGDSNRLTTALNPAIDEADLVASEVIRYPSFDDLEIPARSEEHTSELQSLMRISYAVFRLKKKNTKHTLRRQYINST